MPQLTWKPVVAPRASKALARLTNEPRPSAARHDMMDHLQPRHPRGRVLEEIWPPGSLHKVTPGPLWCCSRSPSWARRSAGPAPVRAALGNWRPRCANDRKPRNPPEVAATLHNGHDPSEAAIYGSRPGLRRWAASASQTIAICCRCAATPSKAANTSLLIVSPSTPPWRWVHKRLIVTEGLNSLDLMLSDDDQPIPNR